MVLLLLISPLNDKFMKKIMLSGLYDLLVFLTTHYSEMPVDFQSSFSETRLVQIRQDLFNALFIGNHDEE